MAGFLTLSLQTINVNACFHDSPLDLPSLLLEAFVYRLRDGRLHEVDIADDLWGEGVPNVLVEFSIFQIIWKYGKIYVNLDELARKYKI